MTHIEQMIQDMCPKGVEWKTLGEVCDSYMGEFVKKDKQNPNGQYPVYNGGSTNTGFYDEYNSTANKVIISARGAAGFVNKVEVDFWAGNSCHVITVNNPKVLNWRFLYYVLKNQEDDIIGHQQKGGGVPAVSKKQVHALEIPVPPLAIQEHIVDILDSFSQLAAELQAELQMRRKQYEHYRTQLLTPHSENNSADKPDGCNWEWKTLGEVGEMIKGSGIQKSDFVEEGKPCIHYGQVHTYFGTFAHKVKSYISEELYNKCKKAHTGDLIIATTSEDVEACCKATAWLGSEDVAVSGDAHIFRHTQNPKYMAYLFQTEMFAEQKRKCATGAKVTRVNGASMLKFKFPFPSLEEQARIVDILDKFEALTTSLSEGIPAEQIAQQKRYEYYRDLLLTFDRKAV